MSDFAADRKQAGMADEKTPLLGQETGRSSTRGAVSGSGGSGKSNAAVIFQRYIRSPLAEMFGVTLAVFAATAAVTANNVLAQGLAQGIVMATVMGGLGAISGGHMNPAFTVACCLSGGIHIVPACCYVCTQIIGGILGAACCRGMMSYHVTTPTMALNGTAETRTVIMYELVGGGANRLADGVPVANGVWCEAMLTIVVVLPFLILSVDTKGRNPMAPLLIGFAYLVCGVAGGSVSGASMNPARSFGPAVMMSDLDSRVWDDHWVYWVGPVAGAIVSGLFYRLVLAAPDRRLICTNK